MRALRFPSKSSGAKSLFPLAVAAMRLVLGRLLPLRSPKTLRPLGGPCPRAVGRTLKPGFIKINSATGAMPHQALPQVCQVFDSAGEISFAITRLFFFRVAPIRLRACHGTGAYLEVGRTFALEGVRIVYNVLLKIFAVELTVAQPIMTR